ncbi:hypothetical protein OAE79_02650 [Rhodopirellula sp.]|nr:hypothetical protein [Rhodopirellula sp.]
MPIQHQSRKQPWETSDRPIIPVAIATYHRSARGQALHKRPTIQQIFRADAAGQKTRRERYKLNEWFIHDPAIHSSAKRISSFGAASVVHPNELCQSLNRNTSREIT